MPDLPEIDQSSGGEPEIAAQTALAILANAPEGLTAQGRLRQMVLDAVRSPSTRRSYGRALDHLFGFAAGRPLTRALFQK